MARISSSTPAKSCAFPRTCPTKPGPSKIPWTSMSSTPPAKPGSTRPTTTSATVASGTGIHQHILDKPEPVPLPHLRKNFHEKIPGAHAHQQRSSFVAAKGDEVPNPSAVVPLSLFFIEGNPAHPLNIAKGAAPPLTTLWEATTVAYSICAYVFNEFKRKACPTRQLARPGRGKRERRVSVGSNSPDWDSSRCPSAGPRRHKPLASRTN